MLRVIVAADQRQHVAEKFVERRYASGSCTGIETHDGLEPAFCQKDGLLVCEEPSGLLRRLEEEIGRAIEVASSLEQHREL